MKSFILFIVLLYSSLSTTAQYKAIRSEVLGNGNPILFLPGFTTPGSVWKDTYQHLTTESQAHFISYAGFNGIPPIKMPWYASIKKELLDYIQTNNLQNLLIIGHSMGGTLAADIAGDLPHRVNKIIFVDALPCMREFMMPGVAAASLHYKSPYNNRILAMEEAAFQSLAKMMATGMTVNKEKLTQITNWILQADRTTYVYGYTDLMKTDVRPQLSNIQADALVLVAPTFGAIGRENMEKQYANLPHKSVVLAPNGKHFIMFDSKTWFYEQINRFIQSEN